VLDEFLQFGVLLGEERDHMVVGRNRISCDLSDMLTGTLLSEFDELFDFASVSNKSRCIRVF
jgi:hypothetical protein